MNPAKVSPISRRRLPVLTASVQQQSGQTAIRVADRRHRLRIKAGPSDHERDIAVGARPQRDFAGVGMGQRALDELAGEIGQFDRVGLLADLHAGVQEFLLRLGQGSQVFHKIGQQIELPRPDEPVLPLPH